VRADPVLGAAGHGGDGREVEAAGGALEAALDRRAVADVADDELAAAGPREVLRPAAGEVVQDADRVAFGPGRRRTRCAPMKPQPPVTR
jgi:hypothetical protein